MPQTAYKFQIVSNSIYEEALNLYLKDGAENNRIKLKVFFENEEKQNVSFEVFFKDAEFKSFIGFVIEPLVRAQQQDKLSKLISIIESDMDIKQTIIHIADIFETKVSLTNPEFKEVGFDVFWGSRGHVIVQKKGQTMSYEDLLKDYPQFDGQYDDRPVMIEFAWSKDESRGVQYRYWTSQQLAKDNGRVDPAIYQNYLNQ